MIPDSPSRPGRPGAPAPRGPSSSSTRASSRRRLGPTSTWPATPWRRRGWPWSSRSSRAGRRGARYHPTLRDRESYNYYPCILHSSPRTGSASPPWAWAPTSWAAAPPIVLPQVPKARRGPAGAPPRSLPAELPRPRHGERGARHPVRRGGGPAGARHRGGGGRSALRPPRIDMGRGERQALGRPRRLRAPDHRLREHPQARGPAFRPGGGHDPRHGLEVDGHARRDRVRPQCRRAVRGRRPSTSSSSSP